MGDDFVAWARELGEIAGEHAARHDLEGSFVCEAYEELRRSGYLALPVPRELGGHGATVREITLAQAELARHCAATALASTMHLHVVAAMAWRWRRGATHVEATLRRVVEDRLVVVSTGGTDRARPTGTASRVDGGWLVSGRKTFASQLPVGDVVATWFVTDDDDRRVLGMGIPLSAAGIEMVETWDTLGMRGTGSHDLVFHDVYVSDAQVNAERPYGELDSLLRVAYIHALTVVAGTYWGIARQTGENALAAAGRDPMKLTAASHRLAGSITAKLAGLRWTMLGHLADLGDDPGDDLQALTSTMLAKRTIAEDGLAIADLAMELVGGASYFRRQPFEQAWRDLRAAKYHPWTPEATLHQVGRLAVGLPADDA
jgi:alkylation response protein AidB-like acyl-CoA dehydrogenase